MSSTRGSMIVRRIAKVSSRPGRRERLEDGEVPTRGSMGHILLSDPERKRTLENTKRRTELGLDLRKPSVNIEINSGMTKITGGPSGGDKDDIGARLRDEMGSLASQDLGTLGSAGSLASKTMSNAGTGRGNIGGSPVGGSTCREQVRDYS